MVPYNPSAVDWQQLNIRFNKIKHLTNNVGEKFVRGSISVGLNLSTKRKKGKQDIENV